MVTFTLRDCLFGDVKLAKNGDPNKCVNNAMGLDSIRFQNFY